MSSVSWSGEDSVDIRVIEASAISFKWDSEKVAESYNSPETLFLLIW